MVERMMTGWVKCGRKGAGLLRRPVQAGRRVRRGCRLTLVLVLLAGCLSCALLGLLVRRATASEAAVSETDWDVMVVIDNSNSMFDSGGIGSDPELRRIEAAQMLVNYLGVDTRASHRLGVIFFGSDAELTVPLTSLTDDEEREQIASAIAHPQRLAWTDPAAALKLALETLNANGDDQRRPVVVLFTDGKPAWSNRPTASEERAVLEELTSVGGQYVEEGITLFVALLSGDDVAPDPQIAEIYVPLWRALTEETGGGLYAVHRADDLVATYHDILLALSGSRTNTTKMEAELRGRRREEIFPVEPGLERLTFLVHRSSSEVDVSFRRPNRQALQGADASVHRTGLGTTEVWMVTHPRPGDWQVVLEGEGSVTLWKDARRLPPTPTAVPTPSVTPSPLPTATTAPTVDPSVQLVVDDWPEVCLVGVPITLTAVLDGDLRAVSDVWMAWNRGSESSSSQKLSKADRAGERAARAVRYRGSLVPERSGPLNVRVWVESEAGVLSSWEGQVRVDPPLRLELVKPRPGEVWRAGRRVSVMGEWIGGGSWAVTSLTGTIRGANDLTTQVFTGTSGAPLTMEAPTRAGQYTVRIGGLVSAPSGLVHEGEAVRTIAVRRPGRAWLLAGSAGVGGIVLVVYGLRRRHRGLPRLVGRLRVLQAPADYTGASVTDLSALGSRSARIGGRRAEIDVPCRGSSWARVRATSDGCGVELSAIDGRTVRVNGHVVSGPHVLRDGDTVTAEDVRLRYEHVDFGA